MCSLVLFWGLYLENVILKEFFFICSSPNIYIFPFLRFLERSLASRQKIQLKLVLIRIVISCLKQLIIPLGYVIFQQNNFSIFQISQSFWEIPLQCVYLQIYLRDLHSLHLPDIQKFWSKILKIKIWSIIKFNLHWIAKSFSAAVSSIYVFIWHNCFENPIIGLNMFLFRKL